MGAPSKCRFIISIADTLAPVYYVIFSSVVSSLSKLFNLPFVDRLRFTNKHKIFMGNFGSDLVSQLIAQQTTSSVEMLYSKVVNDLA